jgi:hypothetical protein
MTRRMTFYDAGIAERVLAEVTRGRTLADACRDEGMPAPKTVRRWAAADRQGFAARLQRAREAGAGGASRACYNRQIADRIIDGIAAGRSLTGTCRDVGLPHRATVACWIADDHDGFAARYRAARETGHCKPSLVAYSPEIADRIISMLMRGEMMVDICQEPDMPHANTVLTWVKEDREGFAARYQRAREAGLHSIAEQLLTIVDDRSNDWIVCCKEDGTIETILDSERVHRARLRFDARRWILSKVLPRDYGERSDIDARSEYESDLAEMAKLIADSAPKLPWENDKPDDA